MLLLGVGLPARYGARYGRQFEGVYRDVAGATRATLVPRVLGTAEERGFDDRREPLLDDASVRPNARGHALVLENAWPGLLPLLRTPPASQTRGEIPLS